MNTITEQQVRHVARLSRLKLSDAEVHEFTEQLGRVLEYVARLNEVNVEGIEPMAHPTDAVNQWREDVPGEPLSVAEALSNAPDADVPFFNVPKVLGTGSGA